MNGIIRRLTTLGLVSAAVSSTVLIPQAGALALTEQQILEKLSSVPVFLIVNAEGESLTASLNNGESDVQVPVVFIDSDEAEAFLERAEAEQAEFAGDARIAVLLLSQVYEEATDQLENANSLVYIPSTESVNQAAQIVNQEIQGVPLFAAVDLENEQYLLTGENRLPMFFSIEDLQVQLATLVEENPELEDSIGVEIITFESLLSNMPSDDPDLNRFLELIQFVPASETLEYLQSLPRGEAQ